MFTKVIDELYTSPLQWILNLTLFVVVGCMLVLLLQQSDLLAQSSQRVAVLALLHELYRGESLIHNPFSAVFLHLLVSFCNLF